MTNSLSSVWFFATSRPSGGTSKFDNLRAEILLRKEALGSRTISLQSRALESKALGERIWGEIPEWRSTALGPIASRSWGFQVRVTRRETVANKIVAEGWGLDSNRLREAQRKVE
jgi:hypothetical protein